MRSAWGASRSHPPESLLLSHDRLEAFWKESLWFLIPCGNHGYPCFVIDSARHRAYPKDGMMRAHHATDQHSDTGEQKMAVIIGGHDQGYPKLYLLYSQHGARKSWTLPNFPAWELSVYYYHANKFSALERSRALGLMHVNIWLSEPKSCAWFIYSASQTQNYGITAYCRKNR